MMQLPLPADAAGPAGEDQARSFCSVLVASQTYGIDTARICEVLGRRRVERVPLAPSHICGIVPYRGEVLAAVSLRALLGMHEACGDAPSRETGCVLVLEPCGAAEQSAGRGRERFALVVDEVGGVVPVDPRRAAPNPPTLSEAGRMLFRGAYRTPSGLLVELNPRSLTPAGHAATAALTATRTAGPAAESGQEGSGQNGPGQNGAGRDEQEGEPNARIDRR